MNAKFSSKKLLKKHLLRRLEKRHIFHHFGLFVRVMTSIARFAIKDPLIIRAMFSINDFCNSNLPQELLLLFERCYGDGSLGFVLFLRFTTSSQVRGVKFLIP